MRAPACNAQAAHRGALRWHHLDVTASWNPHSPDPLSAGRTIAVASGAAKPKRV